jgi:hypothetical protein
MGQSFGGFAAIGASGESLPGLMAAINFAGGGGGDPDLHPMCPFRNFLNRLNLLDSKEVV